MLLSSFLDGISSHPNLSDARILFCCESNMAHEAGFLSNEVKKYHNSEIITDGRKGKKTGAIAEGWFTTNEIKVSQAYDAWDIVSQNGVTFIKDWVCASPFVKNPIKRRRETREKFVEQLKRYSEIEMPTKDPLSTPRSGVSGCVDKEGRSSSSFTDDLCTAFCLGIHLWKLLRRRQVPHFAYSRVFGIDRNRGDKRKVNVARSVVSKARKRLRMGTGR